MPCRARPSVRAIVRAASSHVRSAAASDWRIHEAIAHCARVRASATARIEFHARRAARSAGFMSVSTAVCRRSTVSADHARRARAAP